ncbi:Hsp20/alpha crystallin family protein [Demequina sp. TTPB684]|uniref:Hsp20/alpha crystallin family protein n=1 Tax=unclassified Demequina TaxID=2620311 RepID=UPI001CF273E4|nr:MULTISPECIES: Hsp20/alpha crystallin family protein [unclassified Demequina]MCB2413969.1 Hsp20/alpha crystallin family protein [Demequina sp. TTPB684]UPU88677.1 Hsp20/alpha crystallin family protein [Demequina sp. TMPB413]
MRRELVRNGIPAAAPWNDDFQRIVRSFIGDADASLAGAFSPALDVEETEDGFTLHVELPGVPAENVDVSIEENVLTISGSRDFYEDKDADKFRRVERRFGTFHRAVRLPDRVDPAGIKAAFKDGLLTVSVPKAESAKPRRIEVTTD